METQASPGYLGLRERTIEVDRELVAMYGPCVLVDRRSPAAKAGIRSDDHIRSINDLTFEEFHRSIPPAGTPFEIHAWRLGLGEFRAHGLLEEPPQERHREWWEQWQPTMPGREVRKDERPLFFQGFVATDRRLTPIDVRYLSVLANYDGHHGIFPKWQTLASDLGCSLSTVSRCQRRCIHRGVIQVFSGKRRRSSNRYTVTWPADHERGREKEADAANSTKVSDQAQLLADELLKLCGLDRVAKAVKEAPQIVENWLARRWQAEVIRRVVREELKYRAPSRSLRYFEKPIGKAHGE